MIEAGRAVWAAVVGQRMVKRPFMPADACVNTVQRYGYFPALVNVRVNLAVLRGWMSGVFLPSILKSWAARPMLVTTKVTFPRGADLAESRNRNSRAVTRIVVAWAVALSAVCAKATKPSVSAATTTVASVATNRALIALIGATS